MVTFEQAVHVVTNAVIDGCYEAAFDFVLENEDEFSRKIADSVALPGVILQMLDTCFYSVEMHYHEQEGTQFAYQNVRFVFYGKTIFEDVRAYAQCVSLEIVRDFWGRVSTRVETATLGSGCASTRC